MSEDRIPVRRLLGRLADQLEEYLEGDELALETLGEVLEQEQFGAEEIQAAIMALRSLAAGSVAASSAALDAPPGRAAQRFLGAHERESLSPEAWGYLLDLRRRGSLDPEQFEQVLDRLTSSGVRPVGVEMARDVAAHVALRALEGMDFGSGDGDLAH